MSNFIAVLCAVSLIASSVSAAFQVEADKENVVSSRLAGTWQPHGELTSQLSGHARGTISFESDPNVAGSIPAKYEKFFQGKRIFMAGRMIRSDGKYPFVLIEHRGNPHVVYFRERDADPLGDAESFNLVIAVAKDSMNDLLFIGGDFNNQPFGAYKRGPKEGN